MTEPLPPDSAPVDLSGKPLSKDARLAFDECVVSFKASLLHEVSRGSRGDVIDEADVMQAYKRLDYPPPDALQFADAQSIISQALRENQSLERISYAMALILFVFGLVLLTLGVAISDTATRIGALSSGSIVEMLILIPFRFAINSRRHNIALRMLGMVIDRIDDPAKLAPVLKETFLAVVLGKTSFGASK